MTRLLVVVAAAAQLLAAPALAQSPAPRVDCGSFARFARNIAWLRGLEANQAKVLADVRAQAGERSAPHADTLVRETRRIWKERLAPDDAEADAFKRCIERMGDMGTEG